MQFRRVGHDALLVEVRSPQEAISLAAWARERQLARDVVPGAESVLLDGLRDRDLVDRLSRWSPGTSEPGPLVQLSVIYDGPDLEDVGRLWGCSPEEVVRRHRATEFVSAFCGFAPGFAYLAGLSEELAEVPRLASPRTRVPAGSVSLAGRWCGIYPIATPGGWRILGHTEAELWDASRDQPALLAPGTRVRFQDAEAS